MEKTGVSACYECRRKGLPCYKYEGESKCITCGRAVCSHSHETHNGRDRRAVRAHLQAAYTFLETLVLAPNLETGRDHALNAIGKGADMFGGVHASTDDAVRQDLTENLAVRKQFEGRGLEGLSTFPRSESLRVRATRTRTPSRTRRGARQSRATATTATLKRSSHVDVSSAAAAAVATAASRLKRTTRRTQSSYTRRPARTSRQNRAGPITGRIGSDIPAPF